MEIIRGLQAVRHKQDCALTVGTFDGVHPGHREIIQRLVSLAAKDGLCSTLVTFHPHPKLIVNPQIRDNLKLLTTIDEKISELQSTDLDRLVIIEFDVTFSRMSYEEFVRSVLVEKLGARTLVVGHDHAFGRNREGNFENLRKLSEKYRFKLEHVGPYKVEGETVSSSLLREILQRGQVDRAAHLLGRQYSINGTVRHGSGRGKSLTFPTANLFINHPHKLIPANGVYAVNIDYEGERYKGMLNIGYKPTFSSENGLSVEVHIIDFEENLYNKKLTVYFKHRLRDEKKFDSVEALIAQLEIDRKKSLEL